MIFDGRVLSNRMVERDETEPLQSKENATIVPVFDARKAELVILGPDEHPDGTSIGENAIINVQVVASVPDLRRKLEARRLGGTGQG